MKRKDALTVGEIIYEYLQNRNMEDRLLERRALELWPKIVGYVVNRNTVERRVDNGVLSVRVTSAVIRSELQMSRSALIEGLNRALGKEVIREIRFI